MIEKDVKFELFLKFALIPTNMLKMKKISSAILLLFFSILMADSGLAQQNKCASREILEQELKEHPELSEKFDSFTKSLEQAGKNSIGKQKSTKKRIIPVVFHVIHEYGPENISRAQILSQIERLNKDFAFANFDTSKIPAPFRSLAVDCQLEFRLATKDDKGNCTDGIVRVYSPKTVNASNQSAVKALSYWNSTKYLNVWVVKSIVNNTNYQGDVLGYAQFPFGGLMSTDGIVVRADCVGNIEFASKIRIGRTLVHEIGHWLGLRHIWGDQDCGNDLIDDTPVAFGPNFGICWEDYPYNVKGAKNCGRSKNDTTGEMFMNYMDYVDDSCMAMFTKGQKAVMDLTLNTFRTNIWSDANLIATGTRDEDIANAQLCPPKADFSYTIPLNGDFSDQITMLCEGAKISYRDLSYTTTTSTSWEFEGGNPSTSSLKNVTVTYPDSGLFNVKLTTANAKGTDEKIRNEYVMVSPPLPNYVAPSYSNIEEKFNEWIILNPDRTQYKWEKYNVPGTNGNCFRMVNFGNKPAESDALISPAYSIKAVPSPAILAFSLAFAERGGKPIDNLVLSSSINCGQTWTKLRTWAGTDLITAGIFTESYVPTASNQWLNFYVSLSSLASRENVRFKFEFTSSSTGSNNLYIDQINIGTALSIEDPMAMLNLNLFPNPANNISNVKFFLNRSCPVNASLFDVTGKQILIPFNGVGIPGDNEFAINLAPFQSGIYFLRLDIGDKSVYRKIIKD